MINLVIFLGLVVAELILITLLSRFKLDKWLFGSMLVNLILIGSLGSKTISILGHTTNSGNIFYAAVFFAMFLVIELHGKKAALRSIWFCSIFMLVYLLLTEITINMSGTISTRDIDLAMQTLFGPLPRVIFASLAGFCVTQFVVVHLYEGLREKTHGQMLWLRAISAVVIGQIIDSILFFTIAFARALPLDLLRETLIVGLLIKIAVGVISIPFLYLGLFLSKD